MSENRPMGPNDHAGKNLGRYLERCRRRLGWIARVRIAAAGAGAVAALTLALAAATAYLVPSQGWIVAARLVLYGACAATLVICLVRRIGTRRAAHRAERRIAAFDGRLITWLDASRRRRRPALLPQLAEGALGIAIDNPPRRAAPSWLFAPPLVVVAAAAAVLAWSFTGAPDNWRIPAERLWLGDLLADTRPRVIVEPGNTVVPRGSDVLVRARAHGFRAGDLRLNASFAGSGRWEGAAMMPSPRDGHHEFVLVAVNESVDYFIGTDGINSDRFRIDVADLPVVTKVELALEFPHWTRLETRTLDHGDVVGVEGTQVGVRVEASLPLEDARLVVNGVARDLDDGNGEFLIDAPGTWHVAVTHRGQAVRISDEFLIDLLHDRPPEVEFAFPGRDRSATAIEEVTLRFDAKDDFGIEALTLRYAVNGGAWAELGSERPLDAKSAEAGGKREFRSDHTILLEDLAVGEEKRPVRPGDVVSFHAIARDHRQSTKSALYFIDVRPFDKHYRDTGTSGDGGGSGGQEQELSRRQREILTATWNLMQERDTGARAGADLRDQVELVSILQQTLKDQVETLVARTQGRQLSHNDEVEPYVAELTNAAREMEIAAATLASHELDDAVRPEQRALQHLLTAEAGLRNVNVSMSRSSDGDSVSRSLSELFELETDPEVNRYEEPQAPGSGEGQEETAEEEWRRLTELARRQEELARQQERQASQTPLSRWQLERLQRELDALRDQLGGNQGQQQPRGQGQREQGEERRGQREPRGGLAGGTRSETGDAMEDLDRAREAIERSLANESASGEAAAGAFRQGADALRQGAGQLLRERRGTLTEGLRSAERRTEALVEDQQGILQQLQSLEQDALKASRQGRTFTYSEGRDFEADAATKRRMRRDLERIVGDVERLRQELAQSPEEDAGLPRLLDRALDDLADNRVAEQLSIAAEYFDIGRPLYIAGRERRVHDALERLRSRLANIADRLEDAEASPTAGVGVGVADVQALRRQLREAGAGGDPRALREIAQATARLAGELLGARNPLDFDRHRRDYRGLGADADNLERLYRLTLAELDQLEVALGKAEGAPIRAQELRDEGYDSEAVARYFRELSSNPD